MINETGSHAYYLSALSRVRVAVQQRFEQIVDDVRIGKITAEAARVDIEATRSQAHLCSRAQHLLNHGDITPEVFKSLPDAIQQDTGSDLP